MIGCNVCSVTPRLFVTQPAQLCGCRRSAQHVQRSGFVALLQSQKQTASGLPASAPSMTWCCIMHCWRVGALDMSVILEEKICLVSCGMTMPTNEQLGRLN
jgi:hypothetical protein